MCLAPHCGISGNLRPQPSIGRQDQRAVTKAPVEMHRACASHVDRRFPAGRTIDRQERVRYRSSLREPQGLDQAHRSLPSTLLCGSSAITLPAQGRCGAAPFFERPARERRRLPRRLCARVPRDRSGASTRNACDQPVDWPMQSAVWLPCSACQSLGPRRDPATGRPEALTVMLGACRPVEGRRRRRGEMRRRARRRARGDRTTA